jgi:Primase C terminal 2 (PriCT-2)
VQHTTAEVAVVRDALFALDPRDWHGEHDAWLSLANAAKFEGVSEDDWVKWSLGDEFYRRDERLIRRKWHSLTPTHGGALWAALSEAGIKVRHPSAGHGTRSATVIDEVPYPASGVGISQPTRNWRARVDSILRVLERHQTERTLFFVACVVAEVIAEVGKPKPAVGRQLLEGACPKLIAEIGIAEVRRTIANALANISNKTGTAIMKSSDIEQRERRELSGSTTTSTFHQRAIADLALEDQGRHTQGAVVTGAARVPQVPRMPEGSPWSGSIPEGVEPSLGYAINDLEVTGTPQEVLESLAAPQASYLPPEGAEAREVDPQCAASDSVSPLVESGVPFLRRARRL